MAIGSLQCASRAQLPRSNPRKIRGVSHCRATGHDGYNLSNRRFTLMGVGTTLLGGLNITGPAIADIQVAKQESEVRLQPISGVFLQGVSLGFCHTISRPVGASDAMDGRESAVFVNISLK